VRMYSFSPCFPRFDISLFSLTVCNTGSLATSGYGTALGLITHLFETGQLNNAYYTQTAPYHQGSRLTSYELITMGAPSVMICDTMVGSLFQHIPIHAVVVGADRIARNGDTANKIGTYNAAVLAARHKNSICSCSTSQYCRLGHRGWFKNPHRTSATSGGLSCSRRHPPSDSGWRN